MLSNPSYERITIDYDNDVGDDEAKGENHDSSNPWFATFNNELILGGTFFYSTVAASVGGPIAELIQDEVWNELPSYNVKVAHPEADFTDDDLIDADDIDAIYQAVRDALEDDPDLLFDFNGDEEVDQDDVDYLVFAIIGTVYGDINLDGLVSIGDLTIMSDHFEEMGGWAIGNLNDDLVVGIGDYVILDENYPYTGGLNPIPEPGTLAVVLMCFKAAGRRKRN